MGSGCNFFSPTSSAVLASRNSSGLSLLPLPHDTKLGATTHISQDQEHHLFSTITATEREAKAVTVSTSSASWC